MCRVTEGEPRGRSVGSTREVEIRDEKTQGERPSSGIFHFYDQGGIPRAVPQKKTEVKVEGGRLK